MASPPREDHLSCFQREKYDHLFHVLYDTTNDKTISRADFFELLLKVQKIRGWKTNSPGMMASQRQISKVWSSLIKGSRKYTKKPSQMHIRLEEWRQYWGDFVAAARQCGGWPQRSMDREVEYSWQQDYMNFMFQLMDTNGDGAIDRDEYTLCFSQFGISEEDCNAAYDRFSTLVTASDPADEIPFETFETLWFQYLTSNDPLDPGNYLMGKLTYGDQQ